MTTTTSDDAPELVHVDARRVLPSVPELYRFPLDTVHKHPKVLAAGGLSAMVEGIIELLPRKLFPLDRPELIPPPVRGVMRSVYKERPFGLVIVTYEPKPKCWWIDVPR